MKRYYLTVEEMRQNPGEIEQPPTVGGGTRYEGSTVPWLAMKYFTDKDRPILECGPLFGKFALDLQNAGYRKIHELDFVDMMIFPDRKKLMFHLIDFNMEKFPYPDNFFAGITAWGICEHMENPFLFMREVHRTLAPDGVFIMALPNLMHISSRLQFLFTGVFTRWNERNNHIALMPHGVFEKTFLRFFDLVETVHTKPGNVHVSKRFVKTGFIYKFFDAIFKRFPANQWFGNYVTYVLKKKSL